MDGSGERQDLLAVLRLTAHRLTALQRRLSAAEECADRIAHDILLLLEETGGIPLDMPADGAAPQTRPRKLRPRPAAHAAPQPVAVNLDIKQRADGSAAVSVNFGETFVVPPVLADLLDILARDTHRGADDLVGWKSLDEVAILLAKRSDRRFTRHAVTQQVYRLRKVMIERGGLDPELIQTNRRHGVRIALKRRAGPVIAEDAP
jgi:hypothetical protein